MMEFTAVIVITVVAVFAMINFKDWVNRSEAMGAMKGIGASVVEHRKRSGLLPARSWIDGQVENMPGYVRLGDLRYRGLWVDSESPPETILAYTEKNYRSPFVGKGYVTLRLDGSVEWLGKKEFEALLAQQQSPEEIVMSQRR
ncbi:MAG: hypothetical protein ACYS4W_06995 [Planctomycetota bacterium]